MEPYKTSAPSPQVSAAEASWQKAFMCIQANFLPLLSALEKQDRQLSLFKDVALTVGRSLALKVILHDVLEKIISFVDVAGGVIFVINDETLEMTPACYQNIPDDMIRDPGEDKAKVGECVCGTIAQYDRAIVIPTKASQDPRFTRESQKRAGLEFYAGFPLKAKGKVVGVLCVFTFTPYTPDEDLLDVLSMVTPLVGLAIENARLFETGRKGKEARSEAPCFDGIIASSPRMLEVLSIVRKVMDAPSNILIYGESGTGKELIAKAIHCNSMIKNKPFIAVNCGAIPENLLESELFGSVKGAFTGAYTDRKGLFEAADGGTIFLDELEAMDKSLQIKLLRVLQDRTFFKVGSSQPLTVNVRVIAATNQDLEAAVMARTFREDLYYRLNVVKIELPPLRERLEDLPLLVRYFLHEFSKRFGKNVRRVSDDTLDILMSYAWPGNIRELENMLERAVLITETDEVQKKDLPIMIAKRYEDIRKFWSLDAVVKEHILKVLSIVRGNRCKAARLLGLDVTTLWRKLKKYDVAK